MGEVYPKKALSSFIFFKISRKESLKKEEPNINSAELMAKILQEWKNLSNSEKEPFVLKQKEDIIRFRNQLQEFRKKTNGGLKSFKLDQNLDNCIECLKYKESFKTLLLNRKKVCNIREKGDIESKLLKDQLTTIINQLSIMENQFSIFMNRLPTNFN